MKQKEEKQTHWQRACLFSTRPWQNIKLNAFKFYVFIVAKQNSGQQ
jgi:hypothetical protein